jgi:ribosome assembly protein YihI (activator of Der GTPase)
MEILRRSEAKQAAEREAKERREIETAQSIRDRKRHESLKGLDSGSFRRATNSAAAKRLIANCQRPGGPSPCRPDL